MLIGEYNHVLDAKNRVIVPMKLREKERPGGELCTEFVLTRGTESCLFLYATDAWKQLETAVNRGNLPGEERRRFQRLFSAGGVACACDRQGRIGVPEKLRKHAGLTREVTWVGVGDRAELWDTAKWRAYETENLKRFQETFDKVAETMDQRAPPGPQSPEKGL
jgi:MraZ protein